jgi:hypothetical protein
MGINWEENCLVHLNDVGFSGLQQHSALFSTAWSQMNGRGVAVVVNLSMQKYKISLKFVGHLYYLIVVWTSQMFIIEFESLYVGKSSFEVYSDF